MTTEPSPTDWEQVVDHRRHHPVTLAVLGAGAWGQALAHLARTNQHPVRIWSRRGDLTLEAAITGADLVVSAVPMVGVPELVDRLGDLAIPLPSLLVTATKGLDAATTLTPSQIFQAAFPRLAVVVVSGPNLSVEIEQGLPAATVVACNQPAAAEAAQRVLATESFRIYRSGDPLGAELGGTLKNVMAIARRDQLSLPICQQVDQLLRGEITPGAAVAALMERQLKAEDYQQILRTSAPFNP